MSGTPSCAGSKRGRQPAPAAAGEGQCAVMEVRGSAHSEQLTLPSVVKFLFDTLVWLQLCNPQGVGLFSFVHLPPLRVSRPFAGIPVYDTSLTHAERLRAVGCGFTGKLVRLLALCVGCHFEPQRNRSACHRMMQSIVRRVAAGLAAAVRDKVAKEAGELCAAGQCAAAVDPLHRAIYLGDLHSRALMAWFLMDGREGVAMDDKRAVELAEEGVRLGCHHCQGVMACCCFFGCGCEVDYARSLELARESAERGSKYGQYTMARVHMGGGGRSRSMSDNEIAVQYFRQAAAQGLDAAQRELSIKLRFGVHIVRDAAEAERLDQLATNQGYARCRD